MSSSPSASPFRIFDRERPGHPWERAVEDLCASAVDQRWAVGTNWRMDHRVSEDREEELRGSYFARVGDMDDWWEALGQYFDGELCLPCAAGGPPPVSALVRTPNGNNLCPITVPLFDRLVHVASLNRLLEIVAAKSTAADVSAQLSRVAGRGLPAPSKGATPGLANAQVRELARALERRGESAVREAAGILADALGETEPFWWACFADDIHGLLRSEDASGLCVALGLGHRRAGEVLVVWSYSVADAAPIYRPTVVEASRSPFHHPSPPACAIGITMPLDATARACREVVHRPLKGTSSRSGCTGRFLELDRVHSPATARELSGLRAAHLARLRRELPTPEVAAWLDRHPVPTL